MGKLAETIENRRPDHLAALCQIIDWNVIEQRYQNR